MTDWIDRLLRPTLDRPAVRPPGSCLDADTVAALADGTLSRQERTRAENHVADCPRCQAVLAAIARTTPLLPAAAWWRRPSVGWLIPVAGVAVALIVAIAPQRQSDPGPVPSVAPAERDAPFADRPTTPEAQRAEPPAAPPQLQSRSLTARAGEQRVPARQREAEEKRERLDRKEASPLAKAPQVMADSRIGASAADAAAAPPTVAEQAAAAAAPPPASVTAPSPSQPAANAGVSPATPTATTETSTSADLKMSAPNTVSLRRAAEAYKATPAERLVISPDPKHRWRIGRTGAVDHSSDGGATWQTQLTGVRVTLTAGASPTPNVCWLVGPGGVVVLTTDAGRSWQPVSFPLAADLKSVHATDDRAAVIVTTDGRRFETPDRGRTWVP